jgi:hypothetical protein
MKSEPHSHTNKTLKWGFDEQDNWTTVLYGCSFCDWESLTPDETEEVKEIHEHTEFTEGCFPCKLMTIQLGTGDAGRAEGMSAKKWDAELHHYREARRQGIQPAGTTMKAINEAKQASDNLGSAFNAETMGAADAVTKSKAKLMKETGVA